MIKKTTIGNTAGSTIFATNLYRARTEAGLSQSELARKVWGETEDHRGYKVARNRDRISVYERGIAVPSRENLIALAEALGKTPEQLDPTSLSHVASQGEPAIQMTMVEGKPDSVHLKINTLTSLAKASQIIALLSPEEGASNDNK